MNAQATRTEDPAATGYAAFTALAPSALPRASSGHGDPHYFTRDRARFLATTHAMHGEDNALNTR